MSIITFRGDFLISLVKSYISYLNEHKTELLTLYLSMIILIITTGITAKLTEALILTSGLMVIIQLNTNMVGKLLFFSTMNSIIFTSLCIPTFYLLNLNINTNILFALPKLLLLILILNYGLLKSSLKARITATVICIILVYLSSVN